MHPLMKAFALVHMLRQLPRDVAVLNAFMEQHDLIRELGWDGDI